jgi:hypothetical protein
MALGFSQVTSVANGSGASSRVSRHRNPRGSQARNGGGVGRGAASAPQIGGQDSLGNRLTAIARVDRASQDRVHGHVPQYKNENKS